MAAGRASIQRADTLWNGPQPTSTIERIVGTVAAPQPTSPALAGELFANIVNRQLREQTCGYYNGAPITCGLEGYICATNSVNNAAGCCPSTGLNDCLLPTTCYNSAAVSAYCGADCLSNQYDLKCTDPAYPFCLEKVWDYTPQAYEWGCATVNTVITLVPNQQFESAAFTAGPPSQTSSSVSGNDNGNGNGNGNNDTNSGGNQIVGNYLTDGGSIEVDGAGGNDDHGGAVPSSSRSGSSMESSASSSARSSGSSSSSSNGSSSQRSNAIVRRWPTKFTQLAAMAILLAGFCI